MESNCGKQFNSSNALHYWLTGLFGGRGCVNCEPAKCELASEPRRLRFANEGKMRTMHCSRVAAAVVNRRHYYNWEAVSRDDAVVPIVDPEIDIVGRSSR